jgi:phosphoribosylanthranilate isomerase
MNSTSASPGPVRIKICGITRPEDASACGEFGVDAVGFVFYPPSPRSISAAQAALLSRQLPPFLTRVGLFVNPTRAEVDAVLEVGAINLLQFHGEEDEAFCSSFAVPYIKAARVRPGLDLLEYAALFPTAQAMLCDAFVESYGGAGHRFDWALLPEHLPLPLVLSGGLDADNVGAAVQQVRPTAVDVSSGVESAKGIKDHARLRAFVEKVREADEAIRSSR